MESATRFDLEGIRRCSACLDDSRRFAQRCFQPTKDGLLKKHPPIGFGNEVFFININPRSTNNPAMEWAMQDAENFASFASNRHRDRAYIPGSENFYNVHAAICAAIFPGRPFEEVAIVHELYLCASPNKGGLPGSASPCADRYLKPYLLAARPKLVITFGEDVADYFEMAADGSYRAVTVGTEYSAPVVALPFPRMWSHDLRSKVVKWLAQCFTAISSHAVVPDRDFRWPQHAEVESYELHPLTTSVQDAVKSLAPQARACLQILHLGGRATYREAELKALVKSHAAILRTVQQPWRIFTYYRGLLRKAGAITWKEKD